MGDQWGTLLIKAWPSMDTLTRRTLRRADGYCLWELLMLRFRSVVFLRHHGCQVTQSLHSAQPEAFPAILMSTGIGYETLLFPSRSYIHYRVVCVLHRVIFASRKHVFHFHKTFVLANVVTNKCE